MVITAGIRLGRYELRAPLGKGGMGEVYLAEDTRLGRKAALKLLPSDLTQNEDRLRRFEQEARATSALNHPNILTIYEIGEADGTYFIATEFIEGLTLRERLTRSPVNLSEVLDIAIQITSALAAAHEAGIVHRDIKPENIMIRRDALVKVLDFGLAKLTESQMLSLDPEAPTKPRIETDAGMVMGTVQYMSPEQARGQKVDARTDIFSLGIVVYELLAGKLPFADETPSDVIAAILKSEPAPLADFNQDIPAELERIVSKTLAKDREERYQTAKDLLVDLRRLKKQIEIQKEIERTPLPDNLRSENTTQIRAALPTSSDKHLASSFSLNAGKLILVIAGLVVAATATAYFYLAGRHQSAINSMAILPFVNASADPQTEYLSEGITESLINSLSQLPQLRVTARTTVFRYKGRESDPSQVGRELGVQAILTGKVLQRGDNLIIQADLVKVADGSQLWGEQYSRKLADVLVIQEEIAKQISEKLRLRLSGEEQKQLAKRYTEDMQAYQLYLKGRYFWNKRTPEGDQKSIEYFNQAIEADPNYALAYVGLADAYSSLPFVSNASPKEAFPKAKAAALRALEIDDALAEAHTALAWAKLNFDWDYAGAEAGFMRAIALNLNYPTVHHRYSRYLVVTGRFQEAIAEAKRAQELDPLSLVISTNVAQPLFYARQYTEAIEALRKTLEIDTNFWIARLFLGQAYAQKMMYSEAIAELEKARDFSRGSSEATSMIGYVYAVSGNRSEAQKVIDELKQLSKERYVPPFSFAMVYAGLGENDQALQWLDQAYEDRDRSLILLKFDPKFDGLRSDPRFADLVQRVGLTP